MLILPCATRTPSSRSVAVVPMLRRRRAALSSGAPPSSSLRAELLLARGRAPVFHRESCEDLRAILLPVARDDEHPLGDDSGLQHGSGRCDQLRAVNATLFASSMGRHSR